ncbi:MAG TPA: NIPSNAP family protein [Planctomycetota bacterium]|nr:NIPSNAP family protein [Planctomycetota bacterium]
MTVPIHELRIFRREPSASFAQLRDFVGRLRVALSRHGIAFLGAWKTAGRDDELVWIRAFEDAAHKERSTAAFYGSDLWKSDLEKQADALIAHVDAIDMIPHDAKVLLAEPPLRGFHELRHYRLAPGSLPKMLAVYADLPRVVGEHGVRVLASWTAHVDGTDRFLWLREFRDAAHKARVTKDLYESDRWLRDFKPRTVGVIEERILRDLEPIGFA